MTVLAAPPDGGLFQQHWTGLRAGHLIPGIRSLSEDRPDAASQPRHRLEDEHHSIPEPSRVQEDAVDSRPAVVL